MNSKTIALVIKTEGLEYDDRVRKEIQSVQWLYPELKFKIVVLFPDNKESCGVTSYGVPYHAIHLKTRDRYPSATHLLRKAWDYYRTVRREVKDADAIWVANIECFVCAALLPKKHLLWDLHELPSSLMGSRIKEWLLKYIFRRCKVVLHANPQRINYLEGRGLIAASEKHIALRNYPDFEQEEMADDERYNHFIAWKGDRKCVYLQNCYDEDRAGYESLSAVLRCKELVAVMVGQRNDAIWQRLKQEYGDELEKRVFYVGKVPQLQIPQYVKQCITTVVFYKNTSPNNYYCEANRFYQSVILGLPVVVGCNPPMRELVDQWGFGVALESDGSDVGAIVDAMHEVMNNYEKYQANAKAHCNELLWGNQDEVIKSIVEKIMR